MFLYTLDLSDPDFGEGVLLTRCGDGEDFPSLRHVFKAYRTQNCSQSRTGKSAKAKKEQKCFFFRREAAEANRK